MTHQRTLFLLNKQDSSRAVATKELLALTELTPLIDKGALLGEVSAKTGDGVKEAFGKLVDAFNPAQLGGDRGGEAGAASTPTPGGAAPPA